MSKSYFAFLFFTVELYKSRFEVWCIKKAYKAEGEIISSQLLYAQVRQRLILSILSTEMVGMGTSVYISYKSHMLKLSMSTFVYNIG